jgi:hypothetical protein
MPQVRLPLVCSGEAQRCASWAEMTETTRTAAGRGRPGVGDPGVG